MGTDGIFLENYKFKLIFLRIKCLFFAYKMAQKWQKDGTKVRMY